MVYVGGEPEAPMIIRCLLASILVLLFNLPARAAAVGGDVARRSLEETRAHKALLLDVREHDEVAAGHVKDARTFPYSKVGTPEWDRFVATLPKGTKIYTYCAKGGRAAKVADDLNKRGFAVESAGGFADLKKAGAESE